MENVISLKRGAVSDRFSLLLDYEPEGLAYIQDHLDTELDAQHMMATSTPLNVLLFTSDKTDNIINLKKVNDARHINKFFETINRKLETGGTFVGCFESKEQRKQRIFDKYPLLLAYLFYYFLDFPWKRVFPKVKLLNKIYFGLTKGHNRVLPIPEILGRLVSCGFRIDDYREINNKTYFCAVKKGAPEFDEDPTYGPLITLNRIGYEGERIKVYKCRTMHPYSEYLQEYIYQQYGTKNGDKFENDFRITSWGELMRRCWLDELPMFINYLKGELKLVGVRPLSKHKFDTYPDDLKEKRIKYKPGLIPPFYADLPEKVEEFFETERRYLESYSKAPVKTDIKYFCKAFYNILFKGARSE